MSARPYGLQRSVGRYTGDPTTGLAADGTRRSIRITVAPDVSRDLVHADKAESHPRLLVPAALNWCLVSEVT